MLVLTRRAGETLILTLPAGEQITVSLELIEGHRAKVGVTAPQSIRVIRGELQRE